jgi:hypothetical protein
MSTASANLPFSYGRLLEHETEQVTLRRDLDQNPIHHFSQVRFVQQDVWLDVLRFF